MKILRARCVMRLALCSALLSLALNFFPSRVCRAQEVVDKTVATINGGVRLDVITYSDLVWQIALQPSSPVSNPSSDELNRALQLIINQRLILQEAEKLPPIAPTAKEIEDELANLVKQFPTPAAFEERARRVGLSTERLREIIRQRVAINKYLDFRFRSFTVVTPQEVADYYRDVFVPRWRARTPGVIVPTLEEVRDRIEATLTEDKIESDTDAFLDAARERAEIVILNPV
jgi:hypothetical protein